MKADSPTKLNVTFWQCKSGLKDGFRRPHSRADGPTKNDSLYTTKERPRRQTMHEKIIVRASSQPPILSRLLCAFSAGDKYPAPRRFMLKLTHLSRIAEYHSRLSHTTEEVPTIRGGEGGNSFCLSEPRSLTFLRCGSCVLDSEILPDWRFRN